MGLYRCECGTEKLYPITEVNTGRKTACGCQRIGENNKASIKHGLRKHPAYRAWSSMKERCLNDRCHSFVNYGGRGISIHEDWLDLRKFIAWAEANGYQKGLQLDRINVNGNYEPDNCRFITQKQNANNTRRSRFIECYGRTQTIQQWADEIGINSGVLRRRIDVYKYSIETALTKPVKFK